MPPPLSPETARSFMPEALNEAHQAAAKNEVPVGAIIVDPNGKIIGRAHNQVESTHNPTAHAEILAIQQATAALKQWRLGDCTMYVTLEPCPMCMGALLLARVPLLVYGALEPRTGAVVSCCQMDKLGGEFFGSMRTIGGILESECASVLREFFERVRGRDGRVAEGA